MNEINETDKLDLVVNIEYEDYKRFNFYFSKKRLLFIYIFCFFIFLFTFIYTSIINNKGELTVESLIYGIIFDILFIFLLIFLEYILISLRIKSNFKSDKLIQQEQFYNISANSIQMHTETSETKIKWEDLYKISEDNNSFYIFIAKNKALLIPKRVLEAKNETNKFENIIIQNIDKKKIKFKRLI